MSESAPKTLKELREAAGIGRQQLAGLIGVRLDKIRHYETGFRSIPRERVPLIRQALGISDDVMIAGVYSDAAIARRPHMRLMRTYQPQADRLVQYRIDHNLSYGVTAREMGITVVEYLWIESGFIEFTPDLIIDISYGLGVDFEKLALELHPFAIISEEEEALLQALPEPKGGAVLATELTALLEHYTGDVIASTISKGLVAQVGNSCQISPQGAALLRQLQ